MTNTRRDECFADAAAALATITTGNGYYRTVTRVERFVGALPTERGVGATASGDVYWLGVGPAPDIEVEYELGSDDQVTAKLPLAVQGFVPGERGQERQEATSELMEDVRECLTRRDNGSNRRSGYAIDTQLAKSIDDSASFEEAQAGSFRMDFWITTLLENRFVG